MTARPDDSRSFRDGFGDRFERLARGVGRRLAAPAWLFRAAAVALCVSSLAFVALLVGGFAIGGEQLAIVTEPLPLRLALWLPPFIAAFAAATVAGAVVAWYNGYWSLAGRIHQTILAVLGVLFAWQLSALGFLPLG